MSHFERGDDSETCPSNVMFNDSEAETLRAEVQRQRERIAELVALLLEGHTGCQACRVIGCQLEQCRKCRCRGCRIDAALKQR